MSVELGHAGMDDSIRLQVGDVMPECLLTLRTDGTCEHGGYWLDPVQLHLVLGVDVSPWHERAIIDACRVEDQVDIGTEVLTDGTKRRLWVWSLLTQQKDPTISLELFVRPGEIRLPEVEWWLPYDTEPLCSACAQDMQSEALGTALYQIQHPDKSICGWSTIIVVGRDHKVLAISRPAWPPIIANVWRVQLANAISRRLTPEQDEFPMPSKALWSHPEGHTEIMSQKDLEQHLVAEGWLESPKQQARRRRRAGR